jgi:hypothetical protein
MEMIKNGIPFLKKLLSSEIAKAKIKDVADALLEHETLNKHDLLKILKK